jgi:hypothetical protein
MSDNTVTYLYLVVINGHLPSYFAKSPISLSPVFQFVKQYNNNSIYRQYKQRSRCFLNHHTRQKVGLRSCACSVLTREAR